MDPTLDFWESPQRRVMFKKEYEDGVPSEIMQALFLIYHPTSTYYELPLSSRIKLVSKDLLNDENYDYSPHSSTIDKILNIALTKAQRSMQAWENKLEERDQFIASMPYDNNTFEMLDKLMSQTSKLWDQYMSLRKQLEKDEGKVHGDIEESLSDKGQI